MGADRPRSGQVGASVSGHDPSASRLKLRSFGEGAKRPGLARMICSFEYRFDEVQALRVEPLSGSLRIADF
jgi:hypothetical protein